MATFLLLVALVSIVGSIAYYTYALTNTVIAVIAVAAVFFLTLHIRRTRPHRSFLPSIPHDPFLVVLLLVYIALITGAFTVLAQNPILESVRSPWDRIPPSFFVLFFLTSVLCIILVRRTYERNWLLALGIAQIFSFLFLSVAWVAFPIGYGFDSFIHQATEKVIATQGFITPKPFYYIGQYSLIVFLSKILFVPVAWVDKLLVPLLAALFIPWVVITWLRGNLKKFETAKNEKDDSKNTVRILVRSDQNINTVILFSLFFLPFILSQFTMTTPQALANLLLIILILGIEHAALSLQLLLAATVLLIHPLAGIPAFIFLATKIKIGNYALRVTRYALLSLSIPAVFLLASQFSSQIHIQFAPQNFLPWLQSIEWPGIYRENRFHAPLDLLYFYGFNIKNTFWFFILTSLLPFLSSLLRAGRSGTTRGDMSNPDSSVHQSQIGGVGMRQGVRAAAGAARTVAESSTLRLGLTTFLILLTNYILMRGFLSFSFLISYEQADYSRRVLEIAQFFLLPFFLMGIYWWAHKIPLRPPFIQGEFISGIYVILLAGLLTASLFFTYPQNVDSYAVSHGYNTSAADVTAVHWIANDAQETPYIVLANQAVSAAAVREFGFKKYYATASSIEHRALSTFYYPIPTGSPLYQDYLDMVDVTPSRAIMLRAMDRVRVDRSYFVLNRYWSGFETIKKAVLETTAAMTSIHDDVLIFRYDRAILEHL